MNMKTMEPDPKQAVLQSVYGYSAFRGQQAEIVETLIQGNDALVLMPTGGGKSLCYQIPALVREGVGVVVSPLIALMQDQVSALKALGVNAAFINSSLDEEAIAKVSSDVINQQLDLLYVAPERLLMPSTLQLLEHSKIALFAIDEAHCVSQWGHDFRPEYMGLSVLAEKFPRIPRVALTATADSRTQQEIASNLALHTAAQFISSFDRPNIRYSVADPANAREAMLQFIEQNHRGDSGIIYCLSRKKVEQTASWLNQKGIAAVPYHAGLSAETRYTNQHRFLHEDGLIVVATIAFGMGIDKPDVRFVMHLNLPKSLEAYYQETGRAGRDGLPANAWLAYGLQDVVSLRSMMAQSSANDQYKRVENQKLESMLAFAESTECRRQALLNYFGEALPEPCGNCDNCLEPPDSWDATTAAQKALSCVYRTGQRFGVTYLVDVLTGQSSERIRRFGHDQQSTFGIGAELNANAWRFLYRQLIARGLLAVDVDGHGSIRLTEASRPVLRGEQTLSLRQWRAVSRVKKSRTNTGDAPSISMQDQGLWNALRHLRKQLSDKAGVPAYVVFNDKTLAQMIDLKPCNACELSKVSGVGKHKLEQYGEDFLQVINDYETEDQ